MRIAIFSDVHGNLSAMEAVLADIDRQSPDLTLFAGDLCFLGARPAECLQRVRERHIPSVAGNTDVWLVVRGEPERLRPVFKWGVAQLPPDDLAWLGRLPFSLRVSPTAKAADDLLVVHANPRDLNEIIFPAEADQIAIWRQVRQPDAELEPMLGGVEAAVIAYGHLHIPGIRPWGDLRLVNVASVNMPGDGDPRAKYALLDWRNGRWEVSHNRVGYDTAAEVDAFRNNRPPNWEQAVASLKSEGYYYPQQI